MRIAEISTPEIRLTATTTAAAVSTISDQIKLILSQIESSIQQTEQLSPHTPFPDSLLSDLRLGFSQLSQLAPFPNSLKLHIWKLSYRLWNACVDLSNSATSSADNKSSTDHAKLRHFASDLLSLAADVSGVPSPALKSASFYYKTGLIWHDLRNFDLALTCFEKAADLTSKIEADSSISGNAEEKTLLFEVNLARSRTAWELSDRNLAVTLLNRAKSLLIGSSEHYRALANQYLVFGKSLLSRNDGDSDGVSVTEALKLMNEGLELCERGLSTARTREETIGVKEMRSRALRFVAAVHLQAGEFESVLKCIRILRDKDGGVNGNGGDQHPSLPVLAMKAWLGLGRYAEAEKELRGLVLNKGIPEGIWVSAVEAYFQAAGAAGAEIVKGVFLGLLGRCYVSAGSAVRIVHRVIGDGAGGGGGVIEGSRTRAKVVADLVSDERVVALFAGEKAAKERTAMHALLWNWAAEHFRSKDYEMSADMFEKSMFYVPHDIESRVLRAKGFRVLCLCHLGLSQLDRAQEYINEAGKLEPNIACAFLKFKVHLQKNDHSGAIAQIQTMSTCLDFMPDFLSLSAHEAAACRALPVAVASLSNLLNFYSSTKSMPTPEVVVLRTLVTILSLDPGNEQEVLKFMKRAHNRVCELGADSFFGRGEVGKRERNWFAVNAWNFGTKAGREKTYDLCAEFLRLASEFHGVRVNSEVEENSTMVCKSIILAVSAMIASEKEKKAPLLNTEVKEAAELLDRAGKILKKNASETQLCVNQSTTIEPDFFYMYILNAYDIHGRLNDTGSQQFLLVKSFATSKACNFKYLLQIGLTASQGPRSNHEVASFALKECLSGMLSSLSPDYQKVALILRKLIALASIHKGDTDDDAVYGTYKQAYGIMVGLREGEYPTEEGKWLAITAWNRAALSVRLGQIDLARKWMNIGLQLARKVSGMETYKACMEDYCANFEKKFPDHVNVERRPHIELVV